MAFQSALIAFNGTEAGLTVATDPTGDAYPVDFSALTDALRQAGANVTEVGIEALKNFTNVIYSQTCNYVGALSTATISQRENDTSLSSDILAAAKSSVDTSCAGDMHLLKIILPIVLILTLLVGCASSGSVTYHSGSGSRGRRTDDDSTIPFANEATGTTPAAGAGAGTSEHFSAGPVNNGPITVSW